MKWIVASVAMVLSAGTPGISQEQPKVEAPKTRLEAFLATKGSLVVKDFYAVGELPGLTLEALVLLEPGKESQKTDKRK